MLQVTLSRQHPRAHNVDLLAVGMFSKEPSGELEPGPGLSDAISALRTDSQGLRAGLKARGFTGKIGQAVALPTFGRHPVPVLLVVGLGQREALNAEALRRATAVVIRQAGRATSIATNIAQAAADPVAAAYTVSEAAVLATYRFDCYKTLGEIDLNPGTEPRLVSLEILLDAGTNEVAGERAVRTGQLRGQATNLARDLSNTPPNDLHPADLAAAAQRAVEGRGVSVRILDEGELRKGGFGGILGVGQGAQHQPRLVELVYTPTEPAGHVVLVGKGITFDSGGLSLKPVDSMMTMKTDMSGAAAVAAVMTALAELDIRLQVTGYLACAENLPSGAALRPDDVLTLRNGRTVEVRNTDAEGRLVMGDALALGAESAPDAIIDVATLTGACKVALGSKYTGLMSNNDQLVDELLVAAREAGEPTWRLPLGEEYRKELVSEIADLKNVGSRWGGALIAGLFLKEFVGGRPWAHLDIAGPARAEDEDGYLAKGSTGTAVRTLLIWLEARSRGTAAAKSAASR